MLKVKLLFPRLFGMVLVYVLAVAVEVAVVAEVAAVEVAAVEAVVPLVNGNVVPNATPIIHANRQNIRA
jgi:hypothetical protein